MSTALALRPFVPSQDFDLSQRFYQALGFRVTHRDDDVAMLKLDGQGFILQRFYVKELAENLMLQILVRDVDAWWAEHVDDTKLVVDFGVKPPKAPSMQSWGMKVGFLFDPAGVLWHIAEVPF